MGQAVLQTVVAVRAAVQTLRAVVSTDAVLAASALHSHGVGDAGGGGNARHAVHFHPTALAGDVERILLRGTGFVVEVAAAGVGEGFLAGQPFHFLITQIVALFTLCTHRRTGNACQSLSETSNLIHRIHHTQLEVFLHLLCGLRNALLRRHFQFAYFFFNFELVLLVLVGRKHAQNVLGGEQNIAFFGRCEGRRVGVIGIHVSTLSGIKFTVALTVRVDTAFFSAVGTTVRRLVLQMVFMCGAELCIHVFTNLIRICYFTRSGASARRLFEHVPDRVYKVVVPVGVIIIGASGVLLVQMVVGNVRSRWWVVVLTLGVAV
mmetsp:Transcript_61939/g.108930  ORF Transcript_61939/g.108930 Transcript_61939/m.108930 type:complete len:320 (-) Transcript_61939:451-1410(-)